MLQEAVQDYAYNLTRFASLAARRPGTNKTTMVFALPSTPGSLFKALSVSHCRINLSKLESRPMRGRPRNIFYSTSKPAATAGHRPRAHPPGGAREWARCTAATPLLRRLRLTFEHGVDRRLRALLAVAAGHPHRANHLAVQHDGQRPGLREIVHEGRRQVLAAPD